jgi:hypothetical protein
MYRGNLHKVATQDEHRVKGGQQVKSLMAALRDALSKAWSSQTSMDPGNWNSHNPAWGQCAVTALLVQEFFGGELLRTTIEGISHYWNVLPNGEEVDLTRHQFGPSVHLDKDPEFRERTYVLSFPATKQRYALLRAKVLRDSRLKTIKKLIRDITKADE